MLGFLHCTEDMRLFNGHAKEVFAVHNVDSNDFMVLKF